MADTVELVRAALRGATDLAETMVGESERVQPGNAQKIEDVITAGGRLSLVVDLSPVPGITLILRTNGEVLSIGSIPLSAPPKYN